MSETRKRLILRFGAVFVFIALGFVMVLVKIVLLQTKERDDYLKYEQKQTKATQVIDSKRGNIFDANHRLLAGSIPTYTFYMDTKAESLRGNNGELFFNYIDSLSHALSLLFPDRTEQQYRQLLANGYKNGERRLRLNTQRATYTQFKAFRQQPLVNQGRSKSGIYWEEGHRRIKPFGSLCSRTIGSIYTETGKGNSGLELSFEQPLAGTPGWGIKQRVGNRMEVLPLAAPIDGQDIVTTIDAYLQDITETELRRTLSQTGGKWACCVLMETATGQIKAITNLDRQADGTYAEQLNHAVTRMEPGSMFKTIALLATLDDGRVQLADTFHVPKGAKWVYQDKRTPISDSHEIEELKGVYTAKQGLTASSNIVLAKIVTKSYEGNAERFVKKLQNMGFRDTFRCEIPGCQAPKIEVPKKGDKETLSRMSFGYNVELPPLYTLMYYNAIANNGKMIAPYIVQRIEDQDSPVKEFRPKTINSSICSRQSLQDIRECLESVVWDSLGTAAARRWSNKAQSKEVHIAGKTGTARVFENGRYINYRHRIAFCGYFPMEQPRYTCICIIHDVSQRDAGNDCGGTVRRVAERVMAHHAVKLKKDDDNTPQDNIPAIKRGMQSAFSVVNRGLDLDLPTSDSQWARIDTEGLNHDLQISSSLVPSVIGMGAKDAVFAIERTGMIASLSGKGKVVSQSVNEGSVPLRGGTVYLQLR